MKTKVEKKHESGAKKKLAKQKYQVVPGLGLRGKDIMMRLKNRSLILKPEGGQYSQDKDVSDALKMTPLDARRAALENAKKVNDLTGKIEADAKSKQSLKQNTAKDGDA